MSMMRVVIQDHTQSKKTTVEMPNDVAMERLLPVLASRMQLPLDQAGNPIVYHLDHRRSGRRLEYEDTLTSAGVEQDDVLTLLPELTAGNRPLPPSVRMRRLNSEHRRLQELASQSDLFHIEEASGNPPELYVVSFQCKGIIGPGGWKPVIGENHRVKIALGAEFPLAPPQLTWLTPIFHPNISADGRQVCIAVWYSGQYLDNLCVMLWRMIQYKNFDPYSALRKDAAQWALGHLHLFPVDSRSLRNHPQTTEPVVIFP